MKCFIKNIENESLYIFLAIFVFIVSLVRDIYFEKEELSLPEVPPYISLLCSDLEKAAGNLNNHEILLALSIGKRDFSPQLRSSLVSTGTMHLVAISAFHTGIMMLIFSAFFRSLLFFVPLRPYKKQILLFFLELAASGYYFFITGTSIPTLRALLFMLFFDLFMIFGVYPHSMLVFACSAAAVSLLVPGSVTSLSFFMSALCVATVLRLWRVLPKSAAVSLVCVSVMADYILLAVYGQLSGVFPLLSPFVNFFVVPLVSLAVPFVTLAQFTVPFSAAAAHVFLLAADFLLSPAVFLITFFSNAAETASLPVVEVPYFIKILFVASFFCALYSAGKVKCLSIVVNICSMLFFFFGTGTPGESFKRSEIFEGKAFCVKEDAFSGRLFFDRYRKNPHINSYFYAKSERMAAECGIIKVVSVHFPEKITEEQIRGFRKKMRFKDAEFYSRE